MAIFVSFQSLSDELSEESEELPSSEDDESDEDLLAARSSLFTVTSPDDGLIPIGSTDDVTVDSSFNLI